MGGIALKIAAERLAATGLDPLLVELILSERAPDSLVEIEKYSLEQVLQHIRVSRLYAENMRAQQKETS